VHEGELMATVRRTITIDEEVARRLTERSKVEDRSMSRIVTRALAAYFETADNRGMTE
jgi:predicted transcriptional regulator